MSRPQIAVVDYHKGNLSSVARGLVRAGADAAASDDPAAIAAADALVIPGVGAFYDAIEFMHASGQDRAILTAAAAGKPVLGICLGLQLLFERGDEGVPDGGGAVVPGDAGAAVPAEGEAAVPGDGSVYGAGLEPGTVFAAEGRRWARGLGLIRGSCTRLESSRLKVPHVGWDQVHMTPAGAADPLLAGVLEGADVYFTHSYAVDGDVDEACVLARTHYARSFACVARSGSVWGCQFHPEKSSATGARILGNFVQIAREVRS